MASSWSWAERSRRGCPPSTAHWPCSAKSSSPWTPSTEVGRGDGGEQPVCHCPPPPSPRPTALPPFFGPCFSPSPSVSYIHLFISRAHSPCTGEHTNHKYYNRTCSGASRTCSEASLSLSAHVLAGDEAVLESSAGVVHRATQPEQGPELNCSQRGCAPSEVP